MKIKKLLTSDYDAFYSMRVKMLETKSERYTAGANDWKNASKEQVMMFLKESENGEDNFVLGAFNNGIMVGMLGFRREKRESINHKGSFWGLFELTQGNPAYEIESKLIQEAIAIVSKYEGFKYIRTVQNTNKKQKLEIFKNHGFTEYGLEKDSIKANGQFYDQVYMKKDL